MALVDEVSAAIADAMRRQEPLRLSALRMLKAALMNRDVEKGRGLDDDRVAAGRHRARQAASRFDRAVHQGRTHRSRRQGSSRDRRPRGVPAARPDPAVVERAVDEAIAETGATSPEDLGRVMKAAMARLAGQNVDGKVVNELVRRKLSP